MLELYENCDNLFHKATLLQIETVSQKLLRFAHRNAPDFTLHDDTHSRAIIRYLNEILENFPNDLTENEIFLLYLSAWTHDYGMIINRDGHSQYSRNIINDSDFIKNIINNEEIVQCLKSVILSHTFEYQDLELINDLRHGVRLRLICSIFRILDSMDITESRSPKEVFEMIQNSDRPMISESRQHWESHIAIKFLNIRNTRIMIPILNNNAEFHIDQLRTEIIRMEPILSVFGFPVPTIEIIHEEENI